MFWTIFLLLFILVVIYLLVVPVILFIDTSKHLYYLQLKGLAKASIERHTKEVLFIKLRVLFFNYSFYPLRRKKRRVKKKKIESQKQRKGKGLDRLRTGIRFLRTFKVKKLYLDLDTGDCILNAKLFPLFAFLDYKLGNFKMNFQGKSKLVLSIQNRPIYMIRSFLINN